MEKKINLEIHIDDREIVHFNSLRITQAFNRHHEFELIINQDVIEQTASFKIDQSKAWVGKSFVVSIDQGNTDFKGIVCEVNLSQGHGLRGNLIVKGYSPTILLETGSHLVSYSDMPLDAIVKKVTSSLASNDMEYAIKPDYTESLKYITQFRESNFAFINRLSAEYGELFYYDGRVLHFGKPANQKTVNLIHGENLNVMNMALRILPANFSYYSYRSQQNSTFDADAPAQVKGLNDYSRHALQQSSSVFQDQVSHPVKPRIESKGQLERLAEKHKAAMAAGLTDLCGESTQTGLNIGSIADVQVSRQDLSGVFSKEALSRFLITEITHHIDGLNRYINSFKGVPADTESLPVEQVQAPVAESQVAIVTDNADPSQTGRVKVQMLWQKENMTTDWIRVLTPDGGSSEPFAKNRGYVFIPEIGDQVIVGFRYNDPDRPFVMGSIFHGATGAGGLESNHMKSIATRSGHLIEFNDSSGGQGITITDINRNIIHIDTQGNNITITANENMSLNAKNMQINVTENLDIQAGKNIGIMAGNNMNVQVGANNQVSVGADYVLNAANITEIAGEAYQSEASNITKKASGELTYTSLEGNVTKHAAKTIFNNSDMDKGNIIKISNGVFTEISKNDYTVYAEHVGTNAAKKSIENSQNGVVSGKPAVAVKQINAKVIVHFRPKSGWRGEEYGFDWLRLADVSPAMPGDVKYETIIGKYYKTGAHTPANIYKDTNSAGPVFSVNDGKSVLNAGPFQALKAEYDKHTIPWRIKKDAAGTELKDSAGNPRKEEYFVPWLSLYPKNAGHPAAATTYANTKAVLSLIVDIEEDADSIEFDDNPNFTISPKQVAVSGKGIHNLNDAVTIECNKEFATHQVITIRTIKTGADGKKVTAVAGRLRVWANSVRKKKKIVLVAVKTSISNTYIATTGQEDLFKKFLNQALINPVVETTSLDVSAVANFNTKYVHSGQIGAYYSDDYTHSPVVANTHRPAGFQSMENYLSTLLPARFNNYFKAFYLNDGGGYVDVSNTVRGLNGYSSGNKVVLFPTKNDETAAHEFLHSLNLPHTFTNVEAWAKAKYTFEIQKTDNVMDYSHQIGMQRASLWQWQWKIAHTSAEHE
eukprot:gene12990-15866_t